MSVIRWLVMQEVCRCFEFARHFESHLRICVCKRRLPINIPLLLCYAVHVLYSQPIRLKKVRHFMFAYLEWLKPGQELDKTLKNIKKL